MNVETFRYDNKIVRAFAIATVIWAIVGMIAGLLAAIQLFYPAANLNLQYVTFGRLRPLHTNAVIFAFVGNGMFMGIYYSLQRLCKARLFSDTLSNSSSCLPASILEMSIRSLTSSRTYLPLLLMSLR